MTDIAITSPLVRIARVLAAENLSANADGSEQSAAGDVDSAWEGELDRARAVLRTLREPSPEMIDAGRAAGSDPAEIWSAMVRVAIEEQAGTLVG
ncbi:MAG: hypothetical protein V4574_14835 [Pseudomonadota bacterium]